MPFVTIRDRAGDEVVTVIEVLSPSNKYAGPDREQYLTKRNQLFAGRTHLVEIDLRRGGPRMPAEPALRGDYCILVSRAGARPEADVWAVGLRQSLPSIPIPLRAPHTDAVLDLQAVLHYVYDAATYHYRAYRQPPQPQLSADDAEWAQQFVPPPE